MIVVVFVISCVVGGVYGGCQAGPGKELLTYDSEYKEPLKSPIRQVVRDVTTKRVECLEAFITKEDLGKGTPPNNKVREYTNKMGYPGDQAGHLVARILGGTGYRTYNIVPQSPKSNTSKQWRTDVEKFIRDRIQDDHVNATFIVEPRYVVVPQPNIGMVNSTRPYMLNYAISFTDGRHAKTGSVDNPKP